MKSLQESLLDNEDKLLNTTDRRKKEIEEFIKDNYLISIEPMLSDRAIPSLFHLGSFKITNDFKVDVDGNVCFYPKSERNFDIEIKNYSYSFSKDKGAVAEVNRRRTSDWDSKTPSEISLTNGLFTWGKIKGNFICQGLRNLKSLKGGPVEVEGDFECGNWTGIKSLKYSPKKVGGKFDCHETFDLTSLQGAPKTVGGDFICYGCNNLSSLQGAPKKVGGNFDCMNCAEHFFEEDVIKYSNVDGKINGRTQLSQL